MLQWVTAAAADKVSGVVLLDLSAAFDLVEPKSLIKKLEIYGLDHNFLAWIQSYLTEQYQSVWIDHVLSDYRKCEIGVPQGSNLEPLFFSIFFNDLMYYLDCETENYADDTTITTSGKTSSEISSELGNVCSVVSLWMRANMLKLNPEKTHLMTVGTSQRLNHLENQVEVQMNGILLEEDPDKVETLLGCQISSNLGVFKAKLKKRLAALICLQNIASFPTKKTIADGIFNSVLTYCLPLFGGCEKYVIKGCRFYKIGQSKLYAMPPLRTSKRKLFDKVEWLTVNQLSVYHTLLLVFKIRQSAEPEYLATYFLNEGREHRIVRRNTKLTLAMKSFTFRGASLWNQLPFSLRCIKSFSNFKRETRGWVINSIPRFVDQASDD